MHFLEYSCDGDCKKCTRAVNETLAKYVDLEAGMSPLLQPYTLTTTHTTTYTYSLTYIQPLNTFTFMFAFLINIYIFLIHIPVHTFTKSRSSVVGVATSTISGAVVPVTFDSNATNLVTSKGHSFTDYSEDNAAVTTLAPTTTSINPNTVTFARDARQSQKPSRHYRQTSQSNIPEAGTRCVRDGCGRFVPLDRYGNPVPYCSRSCADFKGKDDEWYSRKQRRKEEGGKGVRREEGE